MKKIMIVCTILACIASVFYILLASRTISLPPTGYPSQKAMMYVAGACYAIGGLLILVKNRGLWIFGLVMNTLVMGFFFARYINNPAVILSLPGLGTKIPQMILEAGLIYLLIVSSRTKKNQNR